MQVSQLQNINISLLLSLKQIKTKLKGQTGACFNQEYMATDWKFFQGKRGTLKEMEVLEEDNL